jgi:transposase
MVEALTKQVADLLQQLGRSSRNSRLPPSSDGPGARPPASKGGSVGKRKRGGQRGHRGHRRELLPAEQVDEIVDLFPPECENCWAALPQVPDPKACRYQVTEIPQMRARTTEIRAHGVTCGDCNHVTAAKVEGVVPKSPFGPRQSAC